LNSFYSGPLTDERQEPKTELVSSASLKLTREDFRTIRGIDGDSGFRRLVANIIHQFHDNLEFVTVNKLMKECTLRSIEAQLLGERLPLTSRRGGHARQFNREQIFSEPFHVLFLLQTYWKRFRICAVILGAR
jgi:hypothetical protein